MINAKIIEHSVSEAGQEIITLQLHYPKFIHGEFMTHRMFSRNASSSRAIPFEKIVADIEADMAMPVYWGSNKPGMQAGDEIYDKDVAKQVWKNAFRDAKKQAVSMYELGIHKQIVNRLLEPFYNINVLVTATEWENFFALRDHPDAQPEIRALAVTMKEAIAGSNPKLLGIKEWHLPYITQADLDQFYNSTIDDWDWLSLIKLSVARCARVSYLTNDQKEPKIEDDIKLYDRLVGSKPIHASPAEHQATPDFIKNSLWKDYHGNFRGWIQFRKMLEAGLDPNMIWKELEPKMWYDLKVEEHI